MAFDDYYTAKCDMSDKSAKKLFNSLRNNLTCEWAELVGEDDDNYMDILDAFDHFEQARKNQVFINALKEAFSKNI